MTKGILAGLLLASSSGFAQNAIDLSNLFSDEQQLRVVDLVDAFKNFNPPTRQQIDRAQWDPLRKQLSEMSPATHLASIEHYSWRHFEEANSAESTYIPEVNIGYSKAFENASHVHYNIGFAIIRPADTSLAMNSLSLFGEDNANERSGFFSVSVHSRF